MEATWVQRVRNIAKRQAESIVDAKIVDHRLKLRRRDNQEVDAGPIKVKPVGTIALFSYYSAEEFEEKLEPDILVTKDGAIWSAGASQSRFQGETPDRPDSGCWTGDRFLVPVYTYDSGFDEAWSTLLQSRDGGTWSYHLDSETFNNATNGWIYGMHATGTGLVVAVGAFFGPDEDQNLVVSYDFGETWKSLPTLILDPEIDGPNLVSVCLKNEYEWVIGDGITWWCTFDGGGHWSEIQLPTYENATYGTHRAFEPDSGYGSGVRYLNGYWWFYGDPSESFAFPLDDNIGDWNTVLIKTKDLKTFIPVVTPWSATYPAYDQYWIDNGPYTPSNGYSGSIQHMEVNEMTNTMLAVGSSPFTSSVALMSDDGGSHWFEVGYAKDKDLAEELNIEGVYKWADWSFQVPGGIAFGFDWWFFVNPTTPESYYPPMVRISVDGRISEAVFPATLKNLACMIILSGGDTTF